MKDEIGTIADHDFERWLGGEAHVRVPKRGSGLWPRLSGRKAIVRTYALAGLIVGMIIGFGAATALFRQNRRKATDHSLKDKVLSDAGNGAHGV